MGVRDVEDEMHRVHRIDNVWLRAHEYATRMPAIDEDDLR